MAFFVTKDEGRQVLRLEGDVTVRDAGKLAALLSERLDPGLPVQVETARLEDIDTCILQLLYALSKTVSELGFSNPAPVFLNALDRSQMRRALLRRREGA
jgi:anti-anti-sigma regulatory factor